MLLTSPRQYNIAVLTENIGAIQDNYFIEFEFKTFYLKLQNFNNSTEHISLCKIFTLCKF